MTEQETQTTPNDLEGITVEEIPARQLIRVPGLKQYEAELILLLGSAGHATTIDGERVYELWNERGAFSPDKIVEGLTEGVRGIRLRKIAARLGIGYQKAGKLVTELGDRTGYVLKLASYSSSYFRQHERGSLEVVLTQTGTEMYGRINAAVTAHRLQT